MNNKYHAINDRHFGFEVFDDIFKAIEEMRHPEHDMFKIGRAHV